MSGVHDFVDKRQHAQPDPQRQALAHLHKVPVPATKLQYAERSPVVQRSSNSIIASLSSSRQSTHPSALRSAQSLNDHGDGFDTDAEGLDDTTITSAGYDSKDSHRDKNAVFPGIRLPLMNPEGSLRGEQEVVQPGAGDQFIGGDDESYEESEDEESDEREEGQDSLSEDSSRPNVIQEFNSPGYIQYRQQKMPLHKDAALQQIMDSPSLRSFDFASDAMRNAANQSSRITKSSQSRNRHHHQDLDAGIRSQDRGESPSGTKHRLPFKTRPPSNGAAQQFPKQVSPSAPVRTVSADSQVIQQHATSLFQPRPLESQSSNPQIRIDPNNDVAKADSVNGQTNKPPSIYPDWPNEPVGHLHANLQLSTNLEVMSVSSEVADLGDDEFMAGEEQGLGETLEARSAASENHGSTQKRSRSIDYSLDQLTAMEFDQLNAENFHFDPKTKAEALPSHVAGGTLAEKLDYLVQLGSNETKAHQQSSFLASLPIEKYEECGDIMVDKFSDFVKTFKNARQQRRKIAKEFEEEVAKRERRVREKIDAFEKDLSRLKRGGEEVVRKKLAL